MSTTLLISQLALNWYHKYGRKNLPWQTTKKSPYNVWISEIMLQQTQVNIVIPYYYAFIKKFPNINVLYKSSLDAILYIWSGLGYYNRVHNLYKTAHIIKKEFNGMFPNTFHDIIKLPGIGRSTAGAILSFGFNFYFPILDGNIKRILRRFYNINELKKTLLEKKLWKIINLITPIHNTNKFNQALMDIGSYICKKSKPLCSICPFNNRCISALNPILLNIKNKQNNLTSKRELTYWCIILQYKNTIYLEQHQNIEFWKGLFCFPKFNSKMSAINWIKNNKILVYKQFNLTKSKLQISNFLLNLIPIKILIKKKINIYNQNREKIWYNLNTPQHIGLPAPIKKIITNIQNHFN